MGSKLVGILFVAICATMMYEASAGIGPQCLLPLDHGPCRANVPKYGYNPDTDRCEQFLYGGCMGNGNNFDSLSECKQICS
ncbi:kappaPI-actitoxin-Avd3b-like [Colletes latitarsis]|uniref:kappaPI-actitoxin-Avd3b-like n=1 Tax=Colletes latitarsis TaxID=2605962 RepID=UPI0040357FCC